MIAGLRMWFSAGGTSRALAFAIIIIGAIALESNVVAIIKRRRTNQDLTD